LFQTYRDVCRDLLGHVPLLCDPTFAQFLQEIGLGSLGAPEDYIIQLSTLYWFTVEVGICKQEDRVKAYGANLLSSYEELEYCLSGKPEIRTLDAFKAATQNYPIDIMAYQSVYYLTESIMKAKDEVVKFAESIPRPSTIHYNPYTQSVEVVNNKKGLQILASDIKYDVAILEDAIKNNMLENNVEDQVVPLGLDGGAQVTEPWGRPTQREVFGGYDSEFVNPPASAFQTTCSVCHLILRDPYLIRCCGTSFCQTCIQRLQAEKNPCPICREDKFDVFTNMGLKRSLNQLDVYCIHREDGCDWKGELGELDKHVDSCQLMKPTSGAEVCPHKAAYMDH